MGHDRGLDLCHVMSSLDYFDYSPKIRIKTWAIAFSPLRCMNPYGIWNMNEMDNAIMTQKAVTFSLRNTVPNQVVPKHVMSQSQYDTRAVSNKR